MLRVLQSIEGKNVDAEKKAKVQIKRGTFIKVNEATGQFEPAANLTEVNGIVNKDFTITQESAIGLAVSDYDVAQDTIQAGEFGLVVTLLPNEMYATTEYGDLTDVQAAAGNYLTVENGKLVASEEATALLSLGWIMDVGLHKLLGFKVLK